MTYVETKMIDYHVEIKYLSLSLLSKPFNKNMNMQHISNVKLHSLQSASMFNVYLSNCNHYLIFHISKW